MSETLCYMWLDTGWLYFPENEGSSKIKQIKCVYMGHDLDTNKLPSFLFEKCYVTDFILLDLFIFVHVKLWSLQFKKKNKPKSEQR